jgi:autotransporter-associated beta strand protein
VGHSAGFPLARLNLADDTSLQNRVSSGTPTIAIGALSGVAGSSGSGGSGDDGLDVNWSVGGLNTSANFAGNTYNNIGFIKVGTGTWTMSGTNITHSGQTTVNAGTLLTPPQLAIQRAVTNAALSWPQSPTPFRLETTAMFAPADWQNWPGLLTTNGGVITAPVVPTNTTRFFRLRWP